MDNEWKEAVVAFKIDNTQNLRLIIQEKYLKIQEGYLKIQEAYLIIYCNNDP